LDGANLTHRFYDALLSFPQPLSFFPPQFLQHRPPLIVLRYNPIQGEEGKKGGEGRVERRGKRREGIGGAEGREGEGREREGEMVSRESGGEREGV
jgi:hypothetical protein